MCSEAAIRSVTFKYKWVFFNNLEIKNEAIWYQCEIFFILRQHLYDWSTAYLGIEVEGQWMYEIAKNKML